MKSKKVISSLLALSILAGPILFKTSVQAAPAKDSVQNSITTESVDFRNFSTSAQASGYNVLAKINSLDNSSHNYTVTVNFCNSNGRIISTKFAAESGTTFNKFIDPGVSNYSWKSALVFFYVDGTLISSTTVNK